MTIWRQLAAVVLLPGTVVLAVPAVIVWLDGVHVVWWWPAAVALGVTSIAIGLVLIVRTIALFAQIGRGTLAPWDPAKRLVVRGPYRYVRNPMISGVLFVLLGEAIVFGSLPLLVWFGVVLAVNAVYLPLVEERGLRRRFGQDYETYRANVPRWIPRPRPWNGEESAS
jgi:protein-S-isoprenylcysteine O-methyltransferase Ste14